MLDGYPFQGASSIFVQDATTLLRATAAEVEANHYSEKLANQLYYGNQSQSGNFFGYALYGYAGIAQGFAVELTFKEATVPIYIVSPSTPRVKVWLVKEEGAEETLDETEAHTALRVGLSSVPVPNPAEVLGGTLPSAGSDAICAILATDEFWELRRLSKFLSGPHAGEWKCSTGGYLSSASRASGIYATGTGLSMGNSASGLVRTGGEITIPDLIRVLRGGKIGHALAITAPVTKGPANGAFLAPATRNDTRENTTALLIDGKTANPSKGTVDAVPQGLRCAFPAASRASDFGIIKLVAAATYEAIREHGLFVRDSGPNCSFNLADARCLPVGYPHINPFAGATSTGNTATQIAAYVNTPLEALVGSLWEDPTLPHLEEDFHAENAGYLFAKMPWRTLEQLAPRSNKIITYVGNTNDEDGTDVINLGSDGFGNAITLAMGQSRELTAQQIAEIPPQYVLIEGNHEEAIPNSRGALRGKLISGIGR